MQVMPPGYEAGRSASPSVDDEPGNRVARGEVTRSEGSHRGQRQQRGVEPPADGTAPGRFVAIDVVREAMAARMIDGLAREVAHPQGVIDRYLEHPAAA